LEVEKKISSVAGFRLTTRFFYALLIVIGIFILGFAFPWMKVAGIFATLTLCTIVLFETLFLFAGKTAIIAHRNTGKVLSLGDENNITLEVTNTRKSKYFISLYDEIPYQFQLRDFEMQMAIKPRESQLLKYSLRPVTRGEYQFGFVNIIFSANLQLVSRRIQCAEPQTVKVVPSIIQMKKYELIALARISTMSGIKKLRRIGHSYEFEQIKNYSQGDDIRSINWKATARKDSLMVNQYQDERSQQVYMIIDKSRNMHMPFNGLSLLDYSINTSLVLSNIALLKHDKTGLITYSHRIGTTLPAEKSTNQLKKILHALYAEKPQNLEGNYDLLYRSVKNVIKSRSLIMLFLNFESSYAMERALPILQKINRQHLLVVMIFENTELKTYTHQKAEFVSDIYAQTIALKLSMEKKQIVSKLRKYGIQTILSRPEDLSINVVNKYLELKAKGLI
jgi:uncharacterized protein (DUF58 family)